MVGSHNSFTFKNATCKLYNVFKSFWRCQDKSLHEQYDAGVRFFDLRVFRKDERHWSLAHGLVNLYGGYDTIYTLMFYMMTQFPDAHFRVVLEKGDSNVEKIFEDEVADAITALADRVHLYQAIIKSNWKILYTSNQEFIFHDFCYTPVLSGESFWYNVKHFKLSSIKKYAKKHNPGITQEMKNDETNIYFMDFV